METVELKLVAKLLAAHGYRNNTPIEDIHAGRWPKNTKGEYADPSEVIVTTIDGGDKISWTECSRISDDEMREINKSVVNNIYSILSLLAEFGHLPMQPPTIGMSRSMRVGTISFGNDYELLRGRPRLANPIGRRTDMLAKHKNDDQ